MICSSQTMKSSHKYKIGKMHPNYCSLKNDPKILRKLSFSNGRIFKLPYIFWKYVMSRWLLRQKHNNLPKLMFTQLLTYLLSDLFYCL